MSVFLFFVSRLKGGIRRMCSEHDTAIEAAAWELPLLIALFFLGGGGGVKCFASDNDFLDNSAKSYGYFFCLVILINFFFSKE